ncbi:MAG: alpha/beta hydrolase [Verrucomicrobiota bacterium]
MVAKGALCKHGLGYRERMTGATQSIITDRNRELLELATTYSYRELDNGGGDLAAHVFYPGERAGGADPFSSAERPAILFFYSSSWDAGEVSQFFPHCACLAERGMVAIACEYRTESNYGAGPIEGVEDAQAAFRWVRREAKELGVDPEKVVGAGGSGGAFLVVCAAMAEGEAGGGGAIIEGRSGPDAMVLFSPVVDISRKGYGDERFPDAGVVKALNPLGRVGKGLPPTLIFHAVGDRMVPIEGVQKFAKRMRRKKNVCELVEFEGVGHSFFNCNVDYERYVGTLDAADAFLVEQGFLDEREGE